MIWEKGLRGAGACVLAAVLLLAGTVPARAENAHLVVAGGPLGGSFEEYAGAFAAFLNRRLPGVEVSRTVSAGSVENIRRLQSGNVDFAIVYAGDLFLARQGKIAYDPRSYDRVLAAAYLYSAPAQLMVLREGPVREVSDLAGRRLAVGAAGSGTAAAAQRYFNSLGLWDSLKPDFTGYQEAFSSLGNRYVDGIFLFSKLPNPTASQAAEAYQVRFLDLATAAWGADFFNQYPFFVPAVIPAGAYPGVVTDIATFQDGALLVAGSHVPAETVGKVLAEVFSAEGRAWFDQRLGAGSLPTAESGLRQVLTPLHPGAASFWKAQGIKLPKSR